MRKITMRKKMKSTITRTTPCTWLVSRRIEPCASSCSSSFSKSHASSCTFSCGEDPPTNP